MADLNDSVADLDDETIDKNDGMISGKTTGDGMEQDNPIKNTEDENSNAVGNSNTGTVDARAASINDDSTGEAPTTSVPTGDAIPGAPIMDEAATTNMMNETKATTASSTDMNNTVELPSISKADNQPTSVISPPSEATSPYGDGPTLAPFIRPDDETQKKRLPAWAPPTISALVAVVLSLGIGYSAVSSGAVSCPTAGNVATLGSNSTSGGTGSTSIDADAWATIAASVRGSVVAITVTNDQSEAKGSGAVLDKNGDIVTNEHVVDGGGEIKVTMSNGQIYKADLVGTDPTTDLAVIKMVDPPSDLKAIKFADSNKLTVGQGVLAVGNPLGYEDTATTGIVSALNRPVSVSSEDASSGMVVTNAIQIDAAINPGNSGGPTFDSTGRVIGINSTIASTATSSDTAGSIGIGFAIPSDLVQRVTSEIIKNGSAKHGVLGITLSASSSGQSGSSDVTVTVDGVTRAGARVVSVVAGAPASKAGIRKGDVIVGWDDESVDGSLSLMGYVRAAEFGSTHKITLVRDGRSMVVTVKLDKAEEKTSTSRDNNLDQQSKNGQDGSNGGLEDPFGFFGGLGW